MAVSYCSPSLSRRFWCCRRTLGGVAAVVADFRVKVWRGEGDFRLVENPGPVIETGNIRAAVDKKEGAHVTGNILHPMRASITQRTSNTGLEMKVSITQRTSNTEPKMRVSTAQPLR